MKSTCSNARLRYAAAKKLINSLPVQARPYRYYNSYKTSVTLKCMFFSWAMTKKEYEQLDAKLRDLADYVNTGSNGGTIYGFVHGGM